MSSLHCELCGTEYAANLPACPVCGVGAAVDFPLPMGTELQGGKFTVVAATTGGAARAEALWRKAGQAAPAGAVGHVAVGGAGARRGGLPGVSCGIAKRR